ncbi:HpcH/HpaI aldolase family protein [Aestuariibius sp. 2305UL40-4]|uniref:HpcH/HpaI aldolase family protein n=1 Tax=Aestuariibius violaceus TaxID=3234132 RepID=UPI00345E605D
MGDRISGFRQKLRQGDRLTGTFVKTPAHEIVEVLARTGLDFLCLDAEHAPFDRARLDACLAVSCALDMPTLVRIPESSPSRILTTLDAGATGIVVPHVDSAAKAQAIAKAARFGAGGRGFAGSTRWAGFATRSMSEVLKQTEETAVIAQIEEPAGVDAASAIAATDGVDALFIGPADLSVAYGHETLDNPDLDAAFGTVRTVCREQNKGFMTWVPSAGAAAAWRKHGLTAFVVGSEHAWIAAGARGAAQDVWAD